MRKKMGKSSKPAKQKRKSAHHGSAKEKQKKAVHKGVAKQKKKKIGKKISVAAKQKNQKGKNTFRFKPFHERLAEISIDVSRKLTKHSATPLQYETFFEEGLKRSREFNCSEDFGNFNRALQTPAQSFVELVHHQDHIVAVILEHIKKPNTLALQPLAELLVCLARDLQSDFYPHFEKVLDCLVFVLGSHSQDTESLEHIFSCLSYIFKFLWRIFVKNMKRLYQLLSPLLGKSYQTYIHTFAAESFAFLLRKTKNKEDIFRHMIDNVLANKDRTYGVARLIFEAIKGVNQQLNSETEVVLNVFLRLVEEDERLEETAVSVWQYVVTHTSSDHISPAVNILLTHLAEKSKDCHPGTKLLLLLLHTTLKKKAGSLIKQPEDVQKILVTMLDSANLQEEVAEPMLEFCADFLSCENVELNLVQRSILLMKVFGSKLPAEQMVEFTRQISAWSMFEDEVLPAWLTYCSAAGCEEHYSACLQLLTELCLNKADPPTCPMSLAAPPMYPLLWPPHKDHFLTAMLDRLQVAAKQECRDDIEQVWALLLVLQHCKGIKPETVEKPLRIICRTLFSAACENPTDTGAVLYQSLITSYVLISKDEFVSFTSTLPWPQLFSSQNTDVAHSLMSVDLVVRVAQNVGATGILTHEKFSELFPIIEPYISAPNHAMRIPALHVCSQFNADSDNGSPLRALQLCLQAEQTIPTVHGFRDRLMHLNKLAYPTVLSQLPNSVSAPVILKYIISNLYINLKLLWPDVMEIIKSYAEGIPQKDFWQVFGGELEKAATRAEGTFKTDDDADDEMEDVSALFKHFKDITAPLSDRPDHLNFRDLLWTSIQSFPQVCQAHADDICQLFFNFLEREYCHVDSTLVEQEDLSKSQNDMPGVKRNHRAIKKSLETHLSVLSLINKPQKLAKSLRLKELYYTLLMHKEPAVSELALKCLLNYKDRHILPYQNHLLKLQTDKTFKSELVLFSLDSDTTVVQEFDRAQLMPIILRIVFGKMQVKAGTNTGGKRHSHTRQGLVVSFLAGCKEQEIDDFLDLVFKPFAKFLCTDLLAQVRSEMTKTNMAGIVPLNKQQALMDTMIVILHKLSPQLAKSCGNLFQMLVTLATQYTRLLKNRERIPSYTINRLKVLRQKVHEALTLWFASFPSHKLQEDDVEALFLAVVWPHIDRLPTEALERPTAIMQLFHEWSNHAEYTDMLDKPGPDGKTVIQNVLEVLLVPQCRPNVKNFIMNVVENLLDTAESSTDAEIDESKGISILLKHLPILLDHIFKCISNSKKLKVAPTKELRVLRSLSAHVNSADDSTKLVKVLLSVLTIRSLQVPEVHLDILKTIQHLLQASGSSHPSFTKQVVALYSTETDQQVRLLTSTVLHLMSPQLGKLAADLNSYERKNLDEPDYARRSKAIQEGLQLAAASPDVNLTLLILHNCTFTITNTGDLALREASMNCLQHLLRNLPDEEFNEVVKQNLLPMLTVQLRQTDQNKIVELLRILSMLVKTFPQSALFKDLQVLVDEKNLDHDVFSNLTHIQQQRRVRGLRQLADKLETVNKRHLLNIVLPLTKGMMKSPDVAVQGAAVYAIGRIAMVFQWSRYIVLLKHFLQLVNSSSDKQKVHIRCVMEILNNFHFDLKRTEKVTKKGKLTKDDKTLEDEEMIQDVSAKDDKEVKEDDARKDDQAGMEEGSMKDGEEVKDCSAKDDETTEEKMEVDEETEDAEVQNEESSQEDVEKMRSVLSGQIMKELHQLLSSQSSGTESEKSVKKVMAKQVPLAFIMVKLLKLLDNETLEVYLPGVLYKMCEFLRSKAESIRSIARQTLVKLAVELGPAYLPFIVKEIKGGLQRGYQLFVRNYSLWVLLSQMAHRKVLKPGDLDPVIDPVCEVFNDELFGNMAADREADGFQSSVSEAKSYKGAEVYSILSRYITASNLPRLVKHLKIVLDGTKSHEVVSSIQEVLKKLGENLVQNHAIKAPALALFAYNLLNDSLQEKTEDEEMVKKLFKQVHVHSTFLVVQEPTRGGKKTKPVRQANTYVLTKFALQLLYLLMKTTKKKEKAYMEMLDPFVKPAVDALFHGHTKVVCESLKCLLQMVTLPLPSLQDCVKKIFQQVFVLVEKLGQSEDDGRFLRQQCFQLMTVMVRENHSVHLQDDQRHILLTYVEQDLTNVHHQATAFNLLRALLDGKVTASEIPEIMEQVAQLAITSASPQTALKSRQAITHYLQHHPQGAKQLGPMFNFFIGQLDYAESHGRESALQFVASVCASFSLKVLSEYATAFFIPVASCLINDESQKCRQLARLAIKALIAKLPADNRQVLFTISHKWLESKNNAIKTLAVHTLCLFVEVEGESFGKHLTAVMPFLKAELTNSDVEDLESNQLLNGMLLLILKLLKHCTQVDGPQFSATMRTIWETIQKNLSHDHTSVQLTCTQAYGQLFCKLQPHQFQESYHISALKELSGAFKDILHQEDSSKELFEQVLKNFVYIVKVLRIPGTPDIGEESGNSIRWLLTTVCRVTRLHPKSYYYQDRCEAFYKFLGAVIMELGEESLTSNLDIVLVPLIREVEKAESPFKVLVQHLLEMIKSEIGSELYTQHLASVKKNLPSNQKKPDAIASSKIVKRKILQQMGFSDKKSKKVKVR